MTQQMSTRSEAEKKHNYRIIAINGLNVIMKRTDGYEITLTLHPFEESGVWYISERIKEESDFVYFLRLCTSFGDWRYPINPLSELKLKHENISDPISATKKYLELYLDVNFLKYDDYIKEFNS